MGGDAVGFRCVLLFVQTTWFRFEAGARNTIPAGGMQSLGHEARSCRMRRPAGSEWAVCASQLPLGPLDGL